MRYRGGILLVLSAVAVGAYLEIAPAWADQPSPPLVYALYGNGDVVTAELAFDRPGGGGRIDFRTFQFATVDSGASGYVYRVRHFLDVKYFLMRLEGWKPGMEGIRKKYVYHQAIFVPIVLTDGTVARQIIEEPNRPRYYLQIIEETQVGGYARRHFDGRDHIFDPADDQRVGGLLVVATSRDYLQEAQKTEFVRRALDEYRRLRGR